MKIFLRHRLCLLAGLLSPLLLAAQAPHPANSAAADFEQLARYQDADLHLQQSHAPVRVVFLGDSITERWGSQSGKWFSESGWINRGIGGQTTAQLLLRERNDALDLHPQAILLEGGANDMRLGFSPAAIRDHFLTMGELADAHHVAVFVAAMTPVCDCVRPLTGLRTVPRIHQLNQLLQDMCRQYHWTYIDLNSPLEDANGRMRADLTVDGVHPNDAGYALLQPRIEAALHDYR